MVGRSESELPGAVEMSFDFAFHKTRTWEYYAVYLDRFRGAPSPILELGSGIGLFLEACRERGIEAHGVEFEVEGVEAARAKGLDAVQHDLRHPLDHLEDETFEAVFSNQVIEHVDDRAQANMFSEAFRLLKPGGQLLINSPCRHYEPARSDPYHVNLRTPSELRDMAIAAGFVDINLGHNRPQSVPEIPDEELQRIWKEYRPDLLSQTAAVLARKPGVDMAAESDVGRTVRRPGRRFRGRRSD